MSELIQKQDSRADIRFKLLTGASVPALIAYVVSSSVALAEDTDRPTIWVELGGQMEQMQGLSSPFTAPFMTAITPVPGPYSGNIFGKGQKPPHFAFGLEGKVAFQPENSDWVISAGVRYGRSHANRHIHQQSPVPIQTFLGVPQGSNVVGFGAAFSDSKLTYGESHAILDFNVGRDVGLGKFGRDGVSEISAGVRSAELSSDKNLTIYGRPEILVGHLAPIGFPRDGFVNYTMWASAERSFGGVGPTVSWDASANLVGDPENGELMLDWGINASVLFGRQKASTDHKTHSYGFGTQPPKYNQHIDGYYHHTPSGSVRSRSVAVPNFGGTIGLSVKYPSAKISLGYRADFFFGAIDAGIDGRRTKDLGFSGPFATIGIGLGG